jgi:hypothetical protein
MAALQLFQHLLPWLGAIDTWHDLTQLGVVWHSSIGHWAIDWGPFAALMDTDVFKPVRQFFNYFIQSGQVWALLIGSIVGYLFRSLTSYG